MYSLWNRLKGRNFDPLNFDDFEEMGDWELEEEPNILSSFELEDFTQNLAYCDINIQDNGLSIISNLQVDKFD